MQYRREIDGLRALAVVPVVLFHAGFSLFSGGYVGVDVFFVISGYLITTIIMSELDHGKFSIVRFYERRARRLLPALFLVMACCLPFAWLWLLPEDMVDFGQSLMAVTTFVSNLLFWREETGYFNNAAELKPLLHTWSLAVEEQFYLLFPLLLMAASRLGRQGLLILLAILSALSLGIAEWGAHNQPAAAWFLLPTRAWELGIGAMVALYFHENNRKPVSDTLQQVCSITGLGLVIYAIVFFSDETPFPGLYGLIPVLGTALIIMFASPATLAGKLLGSKIPVAIGLVSYSAYLWHQPMLAFAKQRSIVEPHPALLGTLAIASFALAWLSWRYVETPFRSPNTVNRKQIFTFSAIGMVLFFALGIAGWATRGFDSRIQDPLAQELLQVSREKTGQQECWEKYLQTPTISSACNIGTAEGQPAFALVGDSHAGSLFSALSSYAQLDKLKGIDLTLFACPVLLASERIDHIKRKQCTEFSQDFRQHIGSGDIPQTLIISTRWTLWLEQRGVDNMEGGKEAQRNIQLVNSHTESMGYIEALSKDYIDSIHLLLDKGHNVILVYPIPEMGWHVPKHLMKKLHIHGQIKPQDASISHDVFKKRNARAYAALDAIGDHPNLVRIYPERLFCNTVLTGRCAAHIEYKPLYSDDNHLSAFGAELIMKEIRKHLNQNRILAKNN